MTSCTCPHCGGLIGGSAPVKPVAGLTPKEDELLTYLERRLSGSRVAPTYEEMAAAIGLKSKSGIFRLVNGLQKRGLVERDRSSSRSIRLKRRAA